MKVRRVVPRDAIPSVEDPAFVDDHPHPDDEVLGVDLGDEVKAYPIRYLNYHEIVNDVVGDVPIAATWCPLCGSAVVYDRRPSEGSLPAGAPDPGTLEFGVSGKLAADDLVMYDRETESEWKQSLGECIAGDLEGAELRVLPATMVTWATFAESNPKATVMAPPGGESEAASDDDDPEPIDYADDPYRDYFDAAGFGLGAHRGSGGREWSRSGSDLDPKAVVLGLEIGDAALGFPLERVEAEGGVVTATVGGEPVVVFATDEGVHAFRDPGYDWSATGGGFRADGVLWDGATGEPLDNPATHVAANRDPLERLPARRLFAFTWRDDHGDDAFYEAGG